MWLTLKKLGIPYHTIDIIRSFHDGMMAQVKLNGTLLEPISVDNGLRQGCCMAPVLCNLYVCFVMECWSTRVQDLSVGVMINYKYDTKLFRRYTCNSTEMLLPDCHYADDAALLSTTRSGAMRALTGYVKTSQDFGLSLSILKTKVMAAGMEACSKDCSPIHTEHGDIEYVQYFTYLGSTIKALEKLDLDVDCRITKASKTFGALRKAVFEDKNLTTLTNAKYMMLVCSLHYYIALNRGPL
ncbi:uncharacterized protein LOC134189930 [Corticium candelabrum]|uniref:uncharacterized protein LOC134189930 n=1 Tax=Corticium candelabrum TaxID=121492 RepID=UPI002E253207|nr:uncharacterized protein LOC134189930 [Corticium candelabrum]